MVKKCTALVVSLILLLAPEAGMASATGTADSLQKEAMPVSSPELKSGMSNLIPDDVLQQASHLGKSVVKESVDRRTATSRHYQLSDGSYIAQLSIDPQNYVDTNGKWEPVNSSLTDAADVDSVTEPRSMESSLRNAAVSMKQDQDDTLQEQNLAVNSDLDTVRKSNFYRALQLPYDVEIPKLYSEGYSVGKGSSRITMIPQKVAPSIGKMEQNTVTYADAWTSSDVTLAVRSAEVKESIVLKDANAPSQFSFKVEGALDENLQSGELFIQPAWLVDAEGTVREVDQTFRTEEDGTYLDLVAPIGELTYPITIDPTIGVLSTSSDTFLYYNSPTANYDSSPTVIVGSEGLPLFKFDLSGFKSDWKMLSASLDLYGTASVYGYLGGSSAINLEVERTSSSWTSTTVTQSNFTASFVTDGNQKVQINGGQTVQPLRLDMTETLKNWINNQAPNYGVGIVPSTVSGVSNSYVYFYAHSKESSEASKKPAITVNYVDPPQGLALTAPNGGENWDSTQTITWNAAPITSNTPIDTGYEDTYYSSYGMYNSTQKIAQTFKTSYATYLSNATWKTSNGNSSYRVAIYSVDANGLPVSEIWGTDITTPAGSEFTTDIGITLAANTQYAFVISNVSNTHPENFPLSALYNDGQFLTWTGSAWTAYQQGGYDLQAKFVFATTSQSSLKYQIQLSTNNGGTWSNVVALTSPGATSYSYNFSSASETTQAKVRIRAYDGFGYGPWDESNAVFTIKHNLAPNAPVSLTPGSASSSSPQLIGSVSPSLNWVFSDPNTGDIQSQFEVMIYQGSTLKKDSGWVSSATGSYTVPSGVLSRNGIYNWKVRTKDVSGTQSSFSGLYYIKVNNLPLVNLTSYTDGQSVPDNLLTFTWTYSDVDSQAQTHYQIIGSQDNWATIAYDSGIQSGSATTFTTSPLAGGTWSFKVKAKDGLEWSNAAVRSNLTLTAAYEPNNTVQQAYPIQYGQEYISQLSTGSDIDYFKFTATANGYVQLLLTVPTGLNYDVYVYDQAQNLIGAGVNVAGKTEDLALRVTGGSVYSIKIAGVNGNYSTTSNYTLKVTPIALQYQTMYQYDANGNLVLKTTSLIP